MSEDQQTECAEELKFISEELEQIQDDLIPGINVSLSNLAMGLVALLLFAIVYMNQKTESEL
jgi:hypothetical protein